MKTKILIYTLTAISILTFTSCNEEPGDTIKPVIDLIAPAEGTSLEVGKDVHFDMELSDNDELNSYKVEIHSNFDGHEHGKAKVKTNHSDATVDFHFERSWDVSGKKNAAIHHHEIEIPENATLGNYHLIIYCTDRSGNESHVARNISIVEKGEGEDHHHD